MVNVASNPSGAKIFVDGKKLGRTPQSVFFRRKGRSVGDRSGKRHYDVRIELEGFQPYEISLFRELDEWFFGNAVFLYFAPIAIIIDSTTGSMYRLTPEQIDAELNSEAQTKIENKKGTLHIGVTLKPNPNWEKIAQLRHHNQ